MSLVFREGRLDDVPAIASLALHSFPRLTRAREDWEKWLGEPELGGVEALWVAADNARVVAACRLYRFGQWIGGRKIPTMGLGLVAVSPTDRRRGLAEELVARGFDAALARGDIASALYPFRTSFYRKLGYGMAGEAFHYRVAPRNLPDSPDREHVRLAETDEDHRRIEAIYDEWAPTQTGQMARAPVTWRNVFARGPSHGVLYQREGERPAGYAIFKYVTDAPPGQRALDIEEIVWLNREARLGLYGWLSSLADQWDYIFYRAHPDEAFAEYLRELRPPAEGLPGWSLWFPSAVTMAGPMFRILDLEHTWSNRPIAHGPPMTVALDVQDRHLPANAGSWRLHLEDGSARVRHGTVAGADLTLRTSIEGLSRIFIGALTPSAAVMGGIAETDSPERIPRLDELLRLPKPWTFDRF